MKNSMRYFPPSRVEAKAAVLRYYQAIQLECGLELQNQSPDWPHVLFLRGLIADLERRAPWLNKECQA